MHLKASVHQDVMSWGKHMTHALKPSEREDVVPRGVHMTHAPQPSERADVVPRGRHMTHAPNPASGSGCDSLEDARAHMPPYPRYLGQVLHPSSTAM